jgi:hypothetical protein
MDVVVFLGVRLAEPRQENGMHPPLISDRLRAGMEARRQRRAAEEARDAAGAPPPPAGDDLVRDCVGALESSVRDSIRATFESWELDLLSEVESAARQGARTTVIPKGNAKGDATAELSAEIAREVAERLHGPLPKMTE